MCRPHRGPPAQRCAAGHLGATKCPPKVSATNFSEKICFRKRSPSDHHAFTTCSPCVDLIAGHRLNAARLDISARQNVRQKFRPRSFPKTYFFENARQVITMRSPHVHHVLTSSRATGSTLRGWTSRRDKMSAKSFGHEVFRKHIFSKTLA